MVFIESKNTNPYYNLALEEYFFERASRDEMVFILWQNYNTIVVGKYQNTAEEINKEFVEANDVKVVRRLSGGGAVYHDKGNLNYTIIVKQEDNFDFNFKHFAVPVSETLKYFGVKAEFTGRNDLTIDGKKFSGNSQYIKNGKILHHGCIMLDSNLSSVSQALRVKEAKFESKSTKSVKSRVTTINENAPRKISMDEFKEQLKKQIIASDVATEYVLSEKDNAEIVRLAETKYSTWEWNYAKSPEYTAKIERKYPFGLVTCYLNVKDGMIKDIKLFGDFFGTYEISELEEKLKGRLIDDKLKKFISSINVGEYIQGMTFEELYQLIAS